MGENFFSGQQQFATNDINNIQKSNVSDNAAISAEKVQDTSSIFSKPTNQNISKIEGKNTQNDTSVAPTLSFGLSQRNIGSVQRTQMQPQIQQRRINPNNIPSVNTSIFLGGNVSTGLTSAANDRTSIFSNMSGTGGYALYDRLDANYKPKQLSEEEVAAQKSLTGEKRTNPKPYNAKYELEENPYAAYSELNPEFLNKPDALEMLNPMNWFKKN